MAWTTEQQQAIGREGCSLLVSAAAGSGKTAVLTERIARLVANGANIEEFLVVTFTEAATAEMKRRITSRLFQAAKEEKNLIAATRLRAQALAVGRANISTLHKFCLYILRRNFPLLGLDPGFRPADDVQSAMLLQQALEETAQARYEEADAAFLELLRAAGGEDELFALAQRLYGFLLAQPDPWGWLDGAAKAYAAEPETFLAHPALLELLGGLQADAAEQVKAIARARNLVPQELSGVRAILDDDMAQLRALSLCRTYAEYREQLLSIQLQTLRFPRGCCFPEQESIKKTREQVRNCVKDQKKLLAQPPEMEANRMAALRPYVDALCAFVRDMDAAYALLKREHGVVDFSDMEHMALRALADEGVQSALRSRFAHVFVDEYQDSSRIQECLIDAVRRGENLFLVGDVKQSIYRFRQADPSLFLEKITTFTGEDGKNAQIHLNVNFRSAKPVIDAVNAVFSRVMTKTTGELDYDERAALHLPDGAQDNPYAGCELHVIGRAAEEPDDEDTSGEAANAEPGQTPDAEELEDAGDAEAEAMLAVRRIRALMREGRCRDPKTGERPFRYSDFAVLLRSHRYAAEVWAQTFAKMGVPVYVQLTGGYFDAIEVQVFLNLLRVIDNRRQDIPLLSVLRSPVFGFSVEELVALRTEYGGETLFERLLDCADGLTTLSGHARETLNALETWRREALRLPLTEFLSQLLDDTGFYDCVGALPGGRERQANLDALVDRARDYADAGFPCDLWSFLQFMDRAAATADMGRAQAGAADVVRVLSMHASKGLEYPVVLCAGLGKAFNKRDLNAALLCERELGLGVRFILRNARADTLLRRAIAKKLWRQQLAEEMRILYVGMTRARERLILIGCEKDAQESVEKARAAELDDAYRARANTYLDWLLPVSLQSGALPLTVHARGGILAAPSPIAGAEATIPQNNETRDALLAALRERLSWRYPYAAAAAIPSKRSVSELLHEREISLRPAPSFSRAADAPLSAAQRGTAVHAVLREIDLAACPDDDAPDFVRAEIARMREWGILSTAQAQAVSASEIARFLESDIGLRLRSASRVERELEFAVLLRAEELGLAQDAEPVLLQGVIDCCFVEDGGWVLLDYKTDRLLPGETAGSAAQAHAQQLSLYALALTQLSGIPVRSRVVALLSAGEAVDV
jgi:ATP-dependent helicase/nuclease subunit A